MTTITLPPEIEAPLRQEAERQGMSPERLAIETLRAHFGQVAGAIKDQHSRLTLADYLHGFIGVIDGTTEALSEHCGERFEEGLANRQGGSGS